MSNLYCREAGIDSLFMENVELIKGRKLKTSSLGTVKMKISEELLYLISSEGWEFQKNDELFVRGDGVDTWITPTVWATKEMGNGKHYITVIIDSERSING